MGDGSAKHGKEDAIEFLCQDNDDGPLQRACGVTVRNGLG